MTVAEFLLHLRNLGIEIWAEEGKLRFSAPPGVFTPALREEVGARKPEILALLAEAQTANQTAAAQPLPRVERSQPIPLSFAQEQLWTLEQLMPGSPLYNMPAAFRLEGTLDAPALARSLNQLVRRHESLRTNFRLSGAQPVQVITPLLELALPFVDLRATAADERDSVVRRLALQEAERPFDLARDPLLRTTLLQTGAQEHVLLLTMHHIISDGWSLGVLLQELETVYAALSVGQEPALPELPVQYADFAVWQREQLQGEVFAAHLSYWKQQLRDAPPHLSLLTDRPRPPVQTHRGATQPVVIAPGVAEAMRDLARREGATPFMTLLAVFQTLLARYSGQGDIVVGSPAANRQRRETEGLVGLFANALALRADLSDNPCLQELLGRVRAVTLEAYEHRELPFGKLVEELNPQRDLSHSPVFQVMFVLQNTPLPSLALSGLRFSLLEFGSTTAKFDITLTLTETEQGFGGALEYNTDLFEADTIARMRQHFHLLLERAVGEPGRRLLDIPLLTEAELRRFDEWNDTHVSYPAPFCLHELFAAQAARTPDRTAVASAQGSLSYAELDRRADQLARTLSAAGAGPEVLVCICAERSPSLLVGLLGILKAGAAYVPLDPSYPTERLAFLLADSQSPLLLTQRELASSLPPHHAQTLYLDDPPLADGNEAQRAPVDPDNVAYVIYTSGSTGKPKGVAITHRNATTLVRWSHTIFSPAELAGVLAATSISFDLSIFELFVPLCCGGTVLLAGNVLHMPAPAGHEVTLINTVPSAMTELVRAGNLPPGARTVNLAGEPLTPSLVNHIYERQAGVRVLNLYGPSEDTTYSTYAIVEPGASIVPIGRPIASTQTYLLDAGLQPVPVGVPGELYLGGAGLARGYLHRPELTAERFLPNPFAATPGARMYRTGDVARYLPDGALVFLGRRDRQVKLRGFRIEPGEIEAMLREHPSVRECAVVARPTGAGSAHLVAYVVPAEPAHVEPAALRGYLQGKLPDYMIPAHFMPLAALPLLPNGKLDQGALPSPQDYLAATAGDFIPPGTPTEARLAEIWCELLELQQVGVRANFFEVGGHSLLATQLVALVRDLFQVELKMRDVFEQPTIAQLASLIELAAENQESDEELAEMMAELEGLTEEEAARRLAAGE